nr:ribonuclease H-like domain-containing protein [Tanacetum cinerariifolium]
MTRNISYLSEYEELDGGYVAFVGDPKGGKITSKGKISTSKFDFEDVYFVKELKFNLFSVLQMCDKKNNVLFTDTECVVLSLDFKLLDESQVLLRVSRKNNMYIIDLKNAAPSVGKFDGKSDEGFFIGYSVNSKAFKRSGPTWLFDIDTLTKSMNYKPIVAGNQSNSSAGKARVETVPDKDYTHLPLWTQDPLLPSSFKDAPGNGFKPSREEEKKDAKDLGKEDYEVLSTKELRVNQEKDTNVNNTNTIYTISPSTNVASIKDNVVDKDIVYEFDDDLNMPNLEEINYSDDDDDVGAEADMTNLDSNIPVSPIPTTIIHKDHPLEQIIRDIQSAPQTKRMTKNVTNYEPKKVFQALTNPSWIEAMQDELLQFKLQQVCTLVDLPYGKRAIGTKWICRNKKDERVTLGNLYLMDDEPMWAAERVVVPTPGFAITFLKTANEFAIKGNIIKIFYHGLNEITQEVLNAKAGGIFLYKTPNQAYLLLEDKALLKLYWAKNQKTKSSFKKTIAFTDKGSNDKPMSHEEEAKFMQTFRKTRLYNDYHDRDSNRDNWRSNERSSYNRDNYQSNTDEKPYDLQNPTYNRSQNHQALIQNLETKFDKLADKQSGRPSGSLPSNTINFTMSKGKFYNPPVNPNDQQDDSENPINFDSDEKDEESTPQPKTKNPKPVKETSLPKPYKPKILYPQCLWKEKLEAQYGKNLDMIRVVRINGASISIMPYSLYANRSFQYPVGIAENMLVEVGRPFLHTADVVIRVKQNQLNLGVRTKRMIFNIDSAMKHSYSNNDTCFSNNVIDEILEKDFNALLDEGNKIHHSIKGTLLEEEILAEFDEFMAMTADKNSDSKSDTEEPSFEKITINTDYKIKISLEEPPMNLKLKPLPDNMEYLFLEEPFFFLLS